MADHIIDCDATPFVPEGWEILPEDQIESRVRGEVALDMNKLNLFLAEGQQGEKYMLGEDLKQILESQPVLPANVLDWLLKPENQYLIPESWKGQGIFFWGTIYREHGNQVVRCLDWSGEHWNWDRSWLASGRDSNTPALLAS